MQTITNAQLIQERLGRWSPSDLAFVDEVNWQCSNDERPSTLRIIARFQRRDVVKGGWPNPRSSFLRVSLMFTGIVNFRMTPLGNSAMQVTGFDIKDVSAQCLEGIRYSVDDYEDGRIAFQCQEVRVEAVD